MVARFPLGIADVMRMAEMGVNPLDEDHWCWCRRHEEAEHVSTPTKREQDRTISCIRIGPFMSEREANRLGEIQVTLSPVSGHYRTRKALGMEVEG